jgi:hypothetical protein
MMTMAMSMTMMVISNFYYDQIDGLISVISTQWVNYGL